MQLSHKANSLPYMFYKLFRKLENVSIEGETGEKEPHLRGLEMRGAKGVLKHATGTYFSLSPLPKKPTLLRYLVAKKPHLAGEDADIKP